MCRFLGCDAGAQPPTISLDLTGESAKTARHKGSDAGRVGENTSEHSATLKLSFSPCTSQLLKP